MYAQEEEIICVEFSTCILLHCIVWSVLEEEEKYDALAYRIYLYHPSCIFYVDGCCYLHLFPM